MFTVITKCQRFRNGRQSSSAADTVPVLCCVIMNPAHGRMNPRGAGLMGESGDTLCTPVHDVFSFMCACVSAPSVLICCDDAVRLQLQG